MREELLSLLAGQKTETVPAFSGLIHVTAEGLANHGLTLYETHHNAQKLAKAAASTFRSTGMPSAALPLDLCAPAEVLGAELNYYENSEYRFPQPAKSLFASTKNLNDAFFQSADFISKGRLPLILEAFQRLKEDIGDKVVISGIIPGPYTLLLYLIEPGGLFSEMKHEPDSIHMALTNISSFLVQIAKTYRNAGADFITVHEMGGSPGFIGPAKFEQFVVPALKQLIAELSKPTVVSVCGNVSKSLLVLNEIGANAISIDQTTDLRAARETLKDTLLFGNLDPVGMLWQGNKDEIIEAVRAAKEAGVDAVWPGCDLVPETSVENLKAFVSAKNDQ
jgi:[methyl-Co(III) methanol-specific corrinoid protein]:coenzyme M methyltransferase